MDEKKVDKSKQEMLIVSLARLLARKHSGTEVIRSAIALLCEGFGFECAFLYEANQFDRLCILECCGENQEKAQKEIPLKSLLSELLGTFASEPVLYCDVQQACSKGQKQLLSILGATTVAAVAITDDEGRIYGLMALCNIKGKSFKDEAIRERLEVAFSLLSGHAAVRMYQHRIGNAQTALESILDNTGIDIYVNDFLNHDILYVNKSMASPYGGQEKFANRKCWQVLFPGQTGPCEFCPQKKLIDEEGNPTKIYTWDYQRAFDGSWFRVFSAAFRWTDGRLAHVVSSADITDNKRNEELIQYMANYDVLTNLPNRRMLVATCETRIQKESDEKIYLLFFDIDGFKKINDTLGHDAGDEFLVQLGTFFSEIPLLKDCIYRNGGDEFVALMGERITEEHVRDLTRFIHARFQKPWQLKNGQVSCNVSVGVSLYPEDGRTSEDLLRKADQAMYHVKNAGGGGVYFANEGDCYE